MGISVPVYLFYLFVSISITLFTIVLVYSDNMPVRNFFYIEKK